MIERFIYCYFVKFFNHHLIGHAIELEATAIGIGSDDLIFQWSFGTATTYYNNGLNPNPYPSPDDTFPFSVVDGVTYFYSGPETITLTITDDDGGTATMTIDIS